MQETRTKFMCPKVQAIKQRMHEYQEKTFPFKISIWSEREKMTTEVLRFRTDFEAQTFLKKTCLKKGLKHYHKGSFGKLDMTLEYSLRKL
jgi:hypothetical protein